MIEMKDLIVRVSGSIQTSNFDEFRESALAIIKDVDRELVTDQDFADAEIVAKSCKQAEIRIAQAKQDAMHQTEDISALFTLMDKLSDQFRNTRLSLESRVKKEKERRKNEVVEDGLSRLKSIVSESLVSHKYAYNQRLIVDAVKGCKSLSSMKERIDKVIESECELINAAVSRYTLNMARIGTAEEQYPGLFFDKKDVAYGEEETVSAVIESRINKYKLDLIVKEERERAVATPVEKKEEPKQSEEHPAEDPFTEQVIFPPGFETVEKRHHFLTVSVLTSDIEGVISRILSISGVVDVQE